MKNVYRLNFSKYGALILFFGCLFIQGSGQSKKIKQSENFKEQTSFSSEEKISNAVKLPPNILKQLARYDDGQLEKCQQDKLTRKRNAAAHFAASKINLNDDKQSDFIVQAQTLCFMGAHNTTFWIFTDSKSKSAEKYQLTFDIAVDFLKILNTSTKGFRDIETASHTAVELYTINWKYDGEKYRQNECTVTDENDKVTKVECHP